MIRTKNAHEKTDECLIRQLKLSHD